MECLGGTISTESEIGRGSKFTIGIPGICKISSGEFTEVKNQKDDKVFEDSGKEDTVHDVKSNELRRILWENPTTNNPIE